LHTWSLAVEEQFYIAMPVIFLLARRLARLPWGLAIGALMALSFGACLLQFELDRATAFYSPLARAWEFLVGSALAAGKFPIPRGALAQAVSLIGFAAIGVALISGGRFPDLLPGAVVLVCFGSALTIMSSERDTFVGTLLRAAPLVGVGRISYSLYLWHWPIIVLARLVWGGALTWPEIALILVVTFTLGYASWRFIEEPARHPRSWPWSFVGVASVAAGGVLVAQALLVNHFHGLPSRFSPAASGYLRDAAWSPPQGCVDGETRACAFGRRDTPTTVAVMGDSIGAALLAGIDESARRSGAAGVFYSKAGCYPVLDVEPQKPDCATFERAAVNRA
jgi:hypothetical protein